MLFKTYQKITTLFKEHHGYMSFSDLRDHQVTVLQLAEMEEEGSLERFARGWYWCKECGYEKPKDYQYIEIAKGKPTRGHLHGQCCMACRNAERRSRKPLRLQHHGQTGRKWIWKILKSDVLFSECRCPGEICGERDRVWILPLLCAEKNLLRLSPPEQQNAGRGKRRNLNLVSETELSEGRDPCLCKQASRCKKY